MLHEEQGEQDVGVKYAVKILWRQLVHANIRAIRSVIDNDVHPLWEQLLGLAAEL